MKSIKQNVNKALHKITDKDGSPTDEEQIEDDHDDDDSFIKFLRYDFLIIEVRKDLPIK